MYSDYFFFVRSTDNDNYSPNGISNTYKGNECTFDSFDSSSYSRMLYSILISISSVLLIIAAEETSNTLNILMPDAVAGHVCIEFHLK